MTLRKLAPNERSPIIADHRHPIVDHLGRVAGFILVRIPTPGQRRHGVVLEVVIEPPEGGSAADGTFPGSCCRTIVIRHPAP